MSCPGRSLLVTARASEVTALRSGPPSSLSGVGTQITTVRARARQASSGYALHPASRIRRTSSSDTSSTWEPAEPRDDPGVPVETHDSQAAGGRLAYERQSYATEPDHRELDAVVPFFLRWLCAQFHERFGR